MCILWYIYNRTVNKDILMEMFLWEFANELMIKGLTTLQINLFKNWKKTVRPQTNIGTAHHWYAFKIDLQFKSNSIV
jgi:hypothetical protein